MAQIKSYLPLPSPRPSSGDNAIDLETWRRAPSKRSAQLSSDAIEENKQHQPLDFAPHQ